MVFLYHVTLLIKQTIKVFSLLLLISNGKRSPARAPFFMVGFSEIVRRGSPPGQSGEERFGIEVMDHLTPVEYNVPDHASFSSVPKIPAPIASTFSAM